jgi:hypothetical protein
VDQLRALLLAGQADGRAGRDAERLIADLDQASRALLDGDTKHATDRLRDLQKRLVDGVREDRVDPKFAQQALDRIGAVAEHYNLKLPSVKPPKKD